MHYKQTYLVLLIVHHVLHILKLCESACTVLFICMFTEFSVKLFKIEIELNKREDILYQTDLQCDMV